MQKNFLRRIKMRSHSWRLTSMIALIVLTTFPVLAASTATPHFTPPVIVYVDPGASGAADGTSWTDAYTDLQTALIAASSNSELWVVAGTYTPGSLRSDTFALKTGVALYGGFAGTEANRADRNPVANATI